MPTNKKRVGFIPREDVMKIIDKLSIENNLSNSKIINILVEEALSIRGMFNKKNGKATKTYRHVKHKSNGISEYSADYYDNEKSTIKTKIDNNKNIVKTILLKQENQDDYDLQTYKQFLSFLRFQKMMDDYSD